ncbi:eCIS core domain-containing protein [Ferruginibacter profundus]
MNRQHKNLLQTKKEVVQQAAADQIGKGTAAITDNRHSGSTQKKVNGTGLPDSLKSGIENISGHSLDDVHVQYNSPQPAKLNAHAYAQGTDIHIAPGQEKHLPHEAWHVVQQKQGRVRPTMQMHNGVKVNDNSSLEHEADIMGTKALGRIAHATTILQQKSELEIMRSEADQANDLSDAVQRKGIKGHSLGCNCGGCNQNMMQQKSFRASKKYCNYPDD